RDRDQGDDRGDRETGENRGGVDNHRQAKPDGRKAGVPDGGEDQRQRVVEGGKSTDGAEMTEERWRTVEGLPGVQLGGRVVRLDQIAQPREDPGELNDGDE